MPVTSTVKVRLGIDSEGNLVQKPFAVEGHSPGIEGVHFRAHVRVQGEIADLENSLRTAGCPVIATIAQAARALTATKQHPTDADAKNWIEEQIRCGYLPALNRGRWPWSPKTLRLDHLARRVVHDFYDH